MYKLTSDSSWIVPVKNTTCSPADSTKTILVDGLTSVSSYHFAIFATNDIGTGPTTAVASYLSQTTYGAPAKPERPTLVQNNGLTSVTLTWDQPDPLNAAPTSDVTYKFEIQKADGTASWTDLALNEVSANVTGMTKIFSMTTLKTSASYAVNGSDLGKAIRIRITATNNLTFASPVSDANLDSAVYQDVPAVYAGASKITVDPIGLTTATISWQDVTLPAEYGHASITGWKYWYNTSTGGVQSQIIASPTI